MVALQMEKGADESLSFKDLNTIVSALPCLLVSSKCSGPHDSRS